MKQWQITIKFKSDASREVVEEIAQHMRWQLDSLNDGTLEMDVDAEPVDEEYSDVEVHVWGGKDATDPD